MPIYSSYDEASGQWLYFRAEAPPELASNKPIRRPTPWQAIGIQLPHGAVPIGSGKYPKGYACAPGQIPCREGDDSGWLEFSMLGAATFVLQWWLLRGLKK